MDYEANSTALQDAWINAVNSDAPDDLAAQQALASCFPQAQAGKAPTSLDFEQRVALEDALRELLLNLSQLALAAPQRLMSFRHPGSSPSTLPTVPRLLNAVLSLVLQQPSSAAAAAAATKESTSGSKSSTLEPANFWRLVEDLMDCSTMLDGADLFTYLEGKVQVFIAPKFFEASKLSLLRTCNHLLKRLSKAHDVQLCGRLLIFLAKLYPVSDKSGLNPHFNINNTLAVPLDDVEEGSVDTAGEPINVAMYRTFWGLQETFQNPAQALQPLVWSKVSDSINSVLQHFKQTPMTVPATGISAEDAQAMDHQGEASKSHASVRYLSGSQLFGLQMRDATFRRHFLVQCFILLQYLHSPNPKDKQPAKPLEGLQDMAQKIYTAIAATRLEGADFGASLAAVLEREGHWLAWKTNNTAPFEKPPAPPFEPAAVEPVTQRRKRPAPSSRQAHAAKLAKMLVVPADTMEGLQLAKRNKVPTLREFLKPVIEGLDPAEGIEEEYRKINEDPIYAWKARRLCSRTELEVFSSEKVKGNIEKAIAVLYDDVREAFQLRMPEAEKKERKAVGTVKSGGTTTTTALLAASDAAPTADAVVAVEAATVSADAA